jgi:hypothetical protein
MVSFVLSPFIIILAVILFSLNVFSIIIALLICDYNDNIKFDFKPYPILLITIVIDFIFFLLTISKLTFG